jgi:hypothetical protein
VFCDLNLIYYYSSHKTSRVTPRAPTTTLSGRLTANFLPRHTGYRWSAKSSSDVVEMAPGSEGVGEREVDEASLWAAMEFA